MLQNQSNAQEGGVGDIQGGGWRNSQILEYATERRKYTEIDVFVLRSRYFYDIASWVTIYTSKPPPPQRLQREISRILGAQRILCHCHLIKRGIQSSQIKFNFICLVKAKNPNRGWGRKDGA